MYNPVLIFADHVLDLNNEHIYRGRTDEFFIEKMRILAKKVLEKPDSIGTICIEIRKERERQEQLKSEGKFIWTCADSSEVASHDKKNSVLTEETGEVAREVVDFGISVDKYNEAKMTFPLHRRLYFLNRIRTELIQVAACCVAWCESIDKEIQILNEGNAQ